MDNVEHCAELGGPRDPLHEDVHVALWRNSCSFLGISGDHLLALSHLPDAEGIDYDRVLRKINEADRLRSVGL